MICFSQNSIRVALHKAEMNIFQWCEVITKKKCGLMQSSDMTLALSQDCNTRPSSEILDSSKVSLIKLNISFADRLPISLILRQCSSILLMTWKRHAKPWTSFLFLSSYLSLLWKVQHFEYCQRFFVITSFWKSWKMYLAFLGGILWLFSHLGSNVKEVERTFLVTIHLPCRCQPHWYHEIESHLHINVLLH